MSSAGNNKAGVTLLELLIAVAIIATIVGISFPALTTGLASVRLASASGSVASFLTSSINTVNRRELASAIVISPAGNQVAVYTAASGDKPANKLEMPSGVTIEGSDPKRYLLFPGGAAPRISVTLRSEKGGRREIQIDPVTAVPKIIHE